jgi:thymidylate synthase
MKILIVTQGAYGHRIVDNITRRGPSDWQIASVSLPLNLPYIIDAPEEHLPESLPQADLIIFLSESQNAPQLIPDLIPLTGAKGVIVPIENSSWMSLGLKGQVKEALDRMGVGSVFPKNFCTLTDNTYGYGDRAETYECKIISQFAHHFGRPEFRIHVNPETNIIEDIEVLRCSPCGSTYHGVEKTVGMHVDEALPKAGLICMQFPCLASMTMEQIDKGLYNTLMHLSGQIFNERMLPHLEPYLSEKVKTDLSDH